MKKIIVSFTLFLCMCTAFAQVKDNLSFVITKFNEEVKQPEDLKFICTIKNLSLYPIIVPIKTANPLPKKYDPVMYYELIFLNSNGKEDTFFKKNTIFDVDRFSPESYDILYSKSSKNFTCVPDLNYFKKEGYYKLRIGFHTSRLNKNYQDLFTDWIKFNVKLKTGYVVML